MNCWRNDEPRLKVSRAVFDASAVLAILNRERGYEAVVKDLYQATISAVNFGEVLKKTAERGGSIPHVRAMLAQQRLDIVAFDAEHAVKAAEIWHEGKQFGLSFADRACVSLGMMRELPVVTAEEAMAKLQLEISVELIRRRATA